MTEFYRQYLAVAVFVVAAFGMVGAMLSVARILRPTLPQDEKYITYESGSDPLPLFGQANVRYYIYALLFAPEAPSEWAQRYRLSPQYRKYVQERLARYAERTAAEADAQPFLPKAQMPD